MGTMTAAPPPDGIEVHQDVPLARHTYLRLGGPARYFAIPGDVAQLELLLGWARSEALSVRVLAGAAPLRGAERRHTGRASGGQRERPASSKRATRGWRVVRVTSVVMHAA